MKKIMMFIIAALLPVAVLNAQTTSPAQGDSKKTTTKTVPAPKEASRVTEGHQPIKKVAGKKQKTSHVKPVTKKTNTPSAKTIEKK